jgi:hypothetical protein
MTPMKRLTEIINGLVAIIGVLSIPVALTSVMIFDSPGSENNTILWVTFWSAVALPFSCLASIITSSILLKYPEKYKKALLVSLFPCLVIAVFVGSLVLIQIYCQGNFSCGY